MECKFHVGQKVVCIVAPAARPGQPNNPVAQGIYTVRSVSVNHLGKPGIRLAEIHNPVGRFKGGLNDEPGFYEWRFRAVTDRKTDISIFKAMLTPKHEAVPA